RPRVTVKIGVAGGENDVFAHGRTFLDTLRPDILCEVLDDRAKPAELMRDLGGCGSHHYLVGEDRLVAGKPNRPDTHLRDWLFTTRTRTQMREAGYPVQS